MNVINSDRHSRAGGNPASTSGGKCDNVCAVLDSRLRGNDPPITILPRCGPEPCQVTLFQIAVNLGMLAADVLLFRNVCFKVV
jgi:hypothetical protein